MFGIHGLKDYDIVNFLGKPRGDSRRENDYEPESDCDAEISRRPPETLGPGGLSRVAGIG
jgi:hypothetical protein